MNIQNDVIGRIAAYIQDKIKEIISIERFFVIIADEVTDRHANKELFLICLHFFYSDEDENLTTHETFFDFVQIEGEQMVRI